MGNRTSHLRIPRSDALPLSRRDSIVSKAHYEGHMTSVLHTTRVSNIFSVMFCNMSLNLAMGFARHRASVVLCFFVSQISSGSFQLSREYSLDPLLYLEIEFFAVADWLGCIVAIQREEQILYFATLQTYRKDQLSAFGQQVVHPISFARGSMLNLVTRTNQMRNTKFQEILSQII